MKEQSQKKSSSQFLQSDAGKTKTNSIEIPSISLPKGGGAIKGIDEKFSVNAVNGTAAFSIPLPFSPARGASPSLSLAYNSGSGNGIFGLGWNLDLPSIKRKTDKGLPQYFDNLDSDTYLFSGAEDLVPVLIFNAGNKKWESEIPIQRNLNGTIYKVQRYRPRIEGLFARIERWTEIASGKIKWRVITKDNITTLFGWSVNSRIFDPSNDLRIFEWLPEFVFDDKGNCSQYIYKEEDDVKINPLQLHNKNRLKNGIITYTNRYLQRVLYGNVHPYKQFGDAFPETDKDEYFFETAFDYGTLKDNDSAEKINTWDFRTDAFSDYKSGFEIRTTRLCKRILLYHHFKGTNEYDGLVKSMNFKYYSPENKDFTFLKSITSYGYIKNTGGYAQKNLPPTEFTYQKHQWNSEVKTITTENLVHAPSGLDEGQYQFTDLFNEGLSGILTEQAGAWYYKHNLSRGRFAQAKLVSPKPSFTGLGSQLQLADLDANGGKQLVNYSAEPKGYFELSDEEEWQPFRNFQTLPNINFNDANTRMVDLNGDGKPDLLMTEDNVFTWYESAGKNGFTDIHRTTKPYDEEAGPNIVFADSTQSIFLADMSGDGLSDIVRIRNGEVCYWPNLGFGKFGTKVGMDNSPWFDHPDAFNPSYLRLADIDGSGTTDIVYLGKNIFSCWSNLSGNSFSNVLFEIEAFPEIHNHAKVSVTDLLGNGVACIVWSSPLGKDANSPLRYIDLMNSRKPHIMIGYKNNMGKEVSMEYKPSTYFYIEDKLAGKPWVTKLHFPVHCVIKTTVTDSWRKTNFSSTFSYHHGYYDHTEREFRGFGRVEQTDVEDFGTFASGNVSSPYITDDHTLYQPPVKSITWYHKGACTELDRILNQFQHEYFAPGSGVFTENKFPEPDIADLDLNPDEWREALRACKGIMLRQEVYELDVDAMSNHEEKRVKLFSTAFHNCHIKCLQPRAQNRHAVFLTTESEAISYTYELDLLATDLHPDPRIAHTLNLSTDEYGNVLESVAIAYHRIGHHTDSTLPAGAETQIANVQQENHLAYTTNRFTKFDTSITLSDNHYRLPLPCEVKTYELTGIHPTTGFYFTLSELRNANIASAQEILYHTLPDSLSLIPQKRGVELVRIVYFKDDLTTALPFGTNNYLGLPYETYKLAFTKALLDAVYIDSVGHHKLLENIDAANTAFDKLNDSNSSGYLSGALLETRFATISATELSGQYWIRSGIAGFASDAANHFYLPERYTDAFGNISTLEYDGKYDIYIQSTMDALGNKTSINSFDYRVLAPREMKDSNDNLSEVWFDTLGLPVAMAKKGKGNEGDSLTGFTDTLANPDVDALIAFFIEEDYDETSPTNPAKTWLGNATVRYVYYFGETKNLDSTIQWGVHPACACGIVREQHVAAGGISPIQVGFEYSDGMGTVLVKKTQAEPAQRRTELRWIANGKTILNNKGKPVKQYEPYFSLTAHKFEEPVEVGVTPVMYYDSAGRLVRTEMPDGTISRVEFSPWIVKSFDANDTICEPDNAWYQRMSNGTTEQQRAARITYVHANTPAQVYLDSLGREVIAIAHNRIKDTGGPLVLNGENYRDEYCIALTKLDAEGKPLWVKDGRGSLVMQYIFPYALNNRSEPHDFVPCYDISGNLLFEHSMDTGDRWMINDAAGKPMFSWDVYKPLENAANEEKRLYSTLYDSLHRPTGIWLKIDNSLPIQIERFEYNDTKMSSGLLNPNLVPLKVANLIGQKKKSYDASGLTETIAFDFKGNPLEVRCQLLLSKRSTITDWQNNPQTKLDTKTFTQIIEYDALTRMTRLFNWHQGEGSRVAVYKPEFSRRSLLQRETLIVGAEKTSSLPGYQNGTTTNAIAEIRYNVKGQREYLRLGNGTVTYYEYDLKTFRLVNLRSTRTTAETCIAGTSSAFTDSDIVQNLFYHYDAVGNITEIKDAAFKDVFFSNQKVEPVNRYEYDALYRLIKATGRENGAANGPPSNIEESSLINHFPCVAADAFRSYNQFFDYDAVGNIKQMRHSAGNAGWTREYEYALDDHSLPASNRLLKTWTGGDPVNNSVTYQYDSHGSILNLQNVPDEFRMQWDYNDMITTINLGNGTAHYQYDSSKQRTRKYLDYGNNVEERIYLGSLEIYQRMVNGTVIEEIETLHLFDGDQRLLMVDQIIQTNNSDLGVRDLYRYTLSNQLGSATLELDEEAKLISYEEYHPYGTSAYRVGRNEAEVKLKRYRYTGMERDEESGLAYHSARYYLSWLGRWLSADPGGLLDGINVFAFSQCRPIVLVDTSGYQSAPPQTGLWNGAESKPEAEYTKFHRGKEYTFLLPDNAPDVVAITEGNTFYEQLAWRVGSRLSQPPLVEVPAPEIDTNWKQWPKPLSRPPLVSLPMQKKEDPTTPGPPEPKSCPPGYMPTKSGLACIETPELIEQRDKEFEKIERKKAILDYTDATLGEGFDNAAKVAEFFSKIIPGPAGKVFGGVGKGFETVHEIYEGAKLVDELTSTLKQSDALEKGSKELSKKGEDAFEKGANEVIDKYLKKKGVKIPEAIRKQVIKKARDYFDEKVRDPALKKGKEEFEKQQDPKDKDKTLWDEFKNFKLPMLHY